MAEATAVAYPFRRLVTKHRGDFNVCSLSCLDPFLCMAFAQLTYRESLRDIMGKRSLTLGENRAENAEKPV